ncbi:hypothetical protein [Streptomyces noursei]|uniref:hypothetical protein n=1 Tax=Streptomyces noursei TaxID=1971 RepID=UPI00380E7D2A
MPESADRHEIRIRVAGTNNPSQDIDDLTAWLEREPWLTRHQHDWRRRPRPEESPGRDAADGAMAVGVDDLVLVVVGAVAAEITKGLGIALREWLRRRREAREEGEEPTVAVGAGPQVHDIGEGPQQPADPGSARPRTGSRADEDGSTGED